MENTTNHFKQNWKNYIIGILVFMVIGGGFFGSLMSGGINNSESLYISDSMGYSQSSKSNYYSSSNNNIEADALERKKIKNANMQLETENYQNDKTSLKTLMSANNAIVLNENEYDYNNNYKTISFTLKLNSDNLDTFLEQSKQYGEVQRLNVYVNDVTGTYADYTERIARYNTQIERYNTMLQKANIEVEDEIQIQNRIDSLENELFYLDKQIANIDEDVAYSEVRLTLKEKPSLLTEIDFLGLKDGFSLFMNSLSVGLQAIFMLFGFILPFGIIYIVIKGFKKLFIR